MKESDQFYHPTSSGNFEWDPVAATEANRDPVDATQSKPNPATEPESESLNAGEPESGDRPEPPIEEAESSHTHRSTATDNSVDSQSDAERSMTSGTCMACGACACVAVVCIVLGLLIPSLKKVSSTEMGVQYDIWTKQLDETVKSGGLFLGPPGYQFIKFPSTYIPVDLDDRTCVSMDGLLVDFSVTFQYQMTAANILPAITKYRDFDTWGRMVEQAGLSAIHHSCSEFVVSEFQNKRGMIQSNMEDNLKIKLQGNRTSGDDGVQAVAVSLQLKDIRLPANYTEAVSNKQKAEEDIELAIAERDQNMTKARTKLLTAKKEAEKIKDSAQNEADVLLTEARLQAEETLYSFEKEADALVQVKEKLNLTTAGVLTYLSSRLLFEATNLKVTTAEPAKLSHRDELRTPNQMEMARTTTGFEEHESRRSNQMDTAKMSTGIEELLSVAKGTAEKTTGPEDLSWWQR